MTEPITLALIGIAVALVTAIGLFLNNWVNARSSLKSKRVDAQTEDSKAKIESSKVDAAAYAAARDIWGALIDDLRAQILDNREELRLLRERIESLEHSRTADHSLIRKVMGYATELRRLLRAAGIDHPDPPSGYVDELLS